MNVKRQSGFTLIELLVVVLIIGILAAIALPQYQVAVGKARFVQAMTLGDALYRSQQLYYMANNTYASRIDELTVIPSGTISDDGTVINAGSAFCKLDPYSYRELYCYIKTYNNENVPAYFHYFYDSRRLCRAYGAEDNVANRVCKAMGGEFVASREEGYNAYLLP